jgi:hypothetical protein
LALFEHGFEHIPERSFCFQIGKKFSTFGGSDKKRPVSGYRLTGSQPYIANRDLKQSEPHKNANVGRQIQLKFFQTALR